MLDCLQVGKIYVVLEQVVAQQLDTRAGGGKEVFRQADIAIADILRRQG